MDHTPPFPPVGMAVARSAVVPLALGLSVAGLALGVRKFVLAVQNYKTKPRPPRGVKKTFFQGGFRPVMDRREAALILGIRDTTNRDIIKEAHRRVMLANHPDMGGSPFIASKINEAKDLLISGKQDAGDRW